MVERAVCTHTYQEGELTNPNHHRQFGSVDGRKDVHEQTVFIAEDRSREVDHGGAISPLEAGFLYGILPSVLGKLGKTKLTWALAETADISADRSWLEGWRCGFAPELAGVATV